MKRSNVLIAFELDAGAACANSESRSNGSKASALSASMSRRLIEFIFIATLPFYRWRTTGPDMLRHRPRVGLDKNTLRLQDDETSILPGRPCGSLDDN